MENHQELSLVKIDEKNFPKLISEIKAGIPSYDDRVEILKNNTFLKNDANNAEKIVLLFDLNSMEELQEIELSKNLIKNFIQNPQNSILENANFAENFKLKFSNDAFNSNQNVNSELKEELESKKFIYMVLSIGFGFGLIALALAFFVLLFFSQSAVLTVVLTLLFSFSLVLSKLDIFGGKHYDLVNKIKLIPEFSDTLDNSIVKKYLTEEDKEKLGIKNSVPNNENTSILESNKKPLHGSPVSQTDTNSLSDKNSAKNLDDKKTPTF